jgi:hypothetical protein
VSDKVGLYALLRPQRLSDVTGIWKKRYRILIERRSILMFNLTIKGSIDKKLEKDTKREFLTNIQEFLLSEDTEFDEEKYKHFLEVIIPKTKTLIRIIRKYIRDKVSF